MFISLLSLPFILPKRPRDSLVGITYPVLIGTNPGSGCEREVSHFLTSSPQISPARSTGSSQIISVMTLGLSDFLSPLPSCCAQMSRAQIIYVSAISSGQLLGSKVCSCRKSEPSMPSSESACMPPFKPLLIRMTERGLPLSCPPPSPQGGIP